MGYAVGLQCIRCGSEYDIGPLYKGCPQCLADGLPTNLKVVVDGAKVRASFNPKKVDGRPASMWRYWEFLPAAPEAAVSLGEGLTPLLHLPRLGKRLGLKNLYVK